MPEFVDVAVEGGAAMTVEVPQNSEPELVEAGRVHDLVDSTAVTLGETIDAINKAAQTVLRKARSSEVVPSEITVEFGVQLAASAGVVIASSAATANMKLVFTWVDLDKPAAKSP